MRYAVKVIEQREASGRIAPKAPDTEDSRYCPACEKYLPKTEFYTDSRAKSGLTRRCRTHHSRKSYETRQKQIPTEPSARYEYNRGLLLAKYGLTPESFEEMVVAQDGLCAICRKPPTRQTRRSEWGSEWHIDHCHASGLVRGLLCYGCNLMIGHAKDDPLTLEAGAVYLRANCCEGAPL